MVGPPPILDYQDGRADPKRRSPYRRWFEIGVLVVCFLIAIFILLPALSHNHPPAKYVHCMANLRNVAQWCMMYAAENKNVYPDNLSTAYRYAMTRMRPPNSLYDMAKHLICPGSSARPTTGPSIDQAAGALAVPATCSYCYVGLPPKSRVKLNQAILVFEASASNHGNSRMFAVAYADGHVEQRPASDHARLMRLFQQGKSPILASDLAAPATLPTTIP